MDIQIKNNKIFFKCNHCKSILKAQKEISGKQGICPHCNEKVMIPEISENAEIVDKK